jgi:Asp-tRNA(Asn)/Glu-tRNA(Gln) amidotransferase A subunit family amidase
MSAALWSLGAAQAAAEIRAGRVTAEALVRASLERIETMEPSIHAFVDRVPAERALEEARRLDARGASVGPLHGVPVAVKEIFDVSGLRCEWGTPIHSGRVPTSDADAVARLRAAGAVILGTTVSTEYAIAAAGPTVNPHDASRSPGGSSSGSAAAVAARMVPLALGSQTVGSIVRPATYCGVYGFKPAHGAISTRGAMPLSPFLDDVGVLARSIDDVALAYALLAHAPAAAAGTESTDRGDGWKPPARVLLVEAPWSREVQPASRVALSRARAALERVGTKVHVEALPEAFDAAPGWLQTILSHDIAAHHRRDLERAGEQMSARLRALIERGRSIDPARYAEAMASASALKDHLQGLLDDGSVLLSPATDGVAPPLSQGTGSPRLQGPYTLAGLAVLAAPAGLIDGLPVGVQLVAAAGHEERLFGTACMLAGEMHTSGWT